MTNYTGLWSVMGTGLSSKLYLNKWLCRYVGSVGNEKSGDTDHSVKHTNHELSYPRRSDGRKLNRLGAERQLYAP